MNTFTRDLAKNVGQSLGKKAAWGDVNPLVIIGLTESMLDLGLTEEQMYKVVKSYARQLAAQVHEDKKVGNVSAERQRQINEAFDFLDDPANFSLAMAEFRTLKSDERNEIKILTEALTRSREELEVARGKELGLSRGLAQLERDREIFNKEANELRMEIPKLNKELQDLYQKSVRHLSASRRWKHKAELMKAYVNSLSSSEARPKLGLHAFEAKWVAVLSLASPADKKSRKPPVAAFSLTGKLSREFIVMAKGLGLSKEEIALVARRWAKEKEGLPSSRDRGAGKSMLTPYLTLISLSAGKMSAVYGWQSPFMRGRVMGSLNPKTMSVGRRDLVLQTAVDSIFQYIEPQIIPGGLLVIGDLVKEVRYLNGGKDQSMRFDTKHLVLGVG